MLGDVHAKIVSLPTVPTLEIDVSTAAIPSVRLNDNHTIPQIGLGVWQVPDDVATDACLAAFEAGYRHIDTAALYGNEEGVGRAIKSSGIPREELFITTKVWNTDQGRDKTIAAMESSLAKLDLDYVDLYLIHWPTPGRDLYLETWETVLQMHQQGLTRSPGVSNFHAEHLRRIVDTTGVTPVINQVELHPWLPQREVRAVDAELGIVTEAWSPLASGGLLEDATLAAIGAKYEKSAAQVMIRWHLQLGNVVLPKSVTPPRIAENIDVFDFELDADDLIAIEGLEDESKRTGPNPDLFNEA
jgi:diketogulonate reductase-like aldo/keto reductase